MVLHFGIRGAVKVISARFGGASVRGAQCTVWGGKGVCRASFGDMNMESGLCHAAPLPYPLDLQPLLPYPLLSLCIPFLYSVVYLPLFLLPALFTFYHLSLFLSPSLLLYPPFPFFPLLYLSLFLLLFSLPLFSCIPHFPFLPFLHLPLLSFPLSISLLLYPHFPFLPFLHLLLNPILLSLSPLFPHSLPLSFSTPSSVSLSLPPSFSTSSLSLSLPPTFSTSSSLSFSFHHLSLLLLLFSLFPSTPFP